MKKIIYFAKKCRFRLPVIDISDGIVRVTPTAFVYAGAGVSIIAGGDVTIDSNAGNSASFLAPNTSTGVSIGDITYKRYIADDNWHLVSAPVASQSIPDFVGDGVNAVAQSGTTSNYGVSYYNNTNTPGTRWTYHNDTPTLENQEILTDFNTGQGYSMKKTAAAGAGGRWLGVGGAGLSVTIPTTTTTGTHLWSTIGNPFPSFLPLNTASYQK